MNKLIKTFISLIILLPVEAMAREPLKVICVPWYNSYNAHQTWSGKEIILKGIAKGGSGTLKYRWDFGDGSSTLPSTVTDSYAISTTHTYKGTENTIFTSKLIVTDAENNTGTDSYRVRIREVGNSAIETDVAIDNALWYLHTHQERLIQNGTECGRWTSMGYSVSSTSAAIEAFENQGVLPEGDRNKNPYVETVERGFNYLFTQCKIITASTQTMGNPDTNGNTIGIGINSNEAIYEIGPIMVAIVGSRQPERIALTGPTNVINRTYQDILQDMVDYCAWAQSDPGTQNTYGGWRYREYDNENGSSDNSVTQWAVIGLAAAETDPWNIPAPQFVRDGLDIWLAYSQNPNNGGFGYSGPNDWVNCAKTGAGIGGLAYLGYPGTSTNVASATNFLANNWYTTNYTYEHFGNSYAMYSIMKGARLLAPPLEYIGTHSWYAEYSDYLLKHQYPDGHWEQIGYLDTAISPSLATAWYILILTKSLFSAPPVACARAYPEEIGVGKPITFDGSNSYHLDPKRKIVKFEWDFENDSIFDEQGSMTTHIYYQPGIFTAVLKITDDNTSPLIGEDVVKVRVRVTPATLTISPGSVTIPVAKTTTITAVVKDEFGNLVEDGTVVNWTTTIGSITSYSLTINGTATAIYYAPTLIGRGTITARATGGENPPDSIPLKVIPGEHHHFNFDNIGSQTAGIPFPITLSAVDFWNNTVTEFNGTVTLTNLKGTITPNIITDFKDGKYVGTVTVFKAGTTTITAEFQDKKGKSNPFRVHPNKVSYFVFDKIGTQTAGINFLINITAYDDWGNTATTFLDSVSLSVEPYQSGNFKNGQWSGAVLIKKAGTTNITAISNDKSGTSNDFFVNPNILDYFSIETVATQMAGIGFSITITANDSYGNISEYNGIAYLKDITNTLEPVVTTNFYKGIWIGTITIKQAGMDTITVWDGTKTGTSNIFYINPNELDYITVLPKTLELPVTHSAPLTAQGYDKYNNEVLNFISNWEVTGKIGYFNPEVGSNTVFTAGSLATKVIIKAFVGNIFDVATVTILHGSLSYISIFPEVTTTVVTGSKTFAARGYDGYGNEVAISGKWQPTNEMGTLSHLTATNTTFIAGTKTGVELLKYIAGNVVGTATITLISDVLDHFIFDFIGTQVADVGFEINITACDKYGNRVEDFRDVGSLNDTTTTLLPKATSNFASGLWSGKVNITKAIEQTIISIFSQGKIGNSNPFEVLPAIVDHFTIEDISTQLCRQPFTVTVTALDRYDNIANYYGTFTLTDTTNSIDLTRNFISGISRGTVAINNAMPDIEITVEDEVRTVKSNPFFVLLDHTKNEHIEGEKIALDVKPYFLPDDYYPIIIKNPEEDAQINTANYYTDKSHNVTRIPNTIYKIEARNEKKELLEKGLGTFSAWLTMGYNDEDIEGKRIKESTLKIYELKYNRWMEVKDSVVSTNENTVKAPISQLGTYILLAFFMPNDLSKFIVYPNPFKPSRGDEKIIFEGLPPNTTIRIYDISGSLIHSIEDVSTIYEWDARGVDSGVYVYIVSYNGDKKVGKIAIVK